MSSQTQQMCLKYQNCKNWVKLGHNSNYYDYYQLNLKYFIFEWNKQCHYRCFNHQSVCACTDHLSAMKGEGSSFKMLVIIIINFNELASLFKASLFHSLEISFQYPHFHIVQNVNISMFFTTLHADLRCVVFLWNPFPIIALHCVASRI